MDTGIGATLREAREAQSRSIEDVASSLRARVTQLRDLEDERFDTFGGDVYAKGFLKSYAAELGLDPAPLLEVYRREVNPEDAQPPTLTGGMARPRRQRSASPPAWAAWLLVGVIALAVVGFIGSLGPGTTPEVAGTDDEVDTAPPSTAEDEDPDVAENGDGDGVGNGGADDEATDEDATDEDATDDVADEVDEEPEPEEPDGVELLLEFEDRSWTRVEVDGTVVLEQIVEAGEILPFDGEDEIFVRLGNAGGVRAQLNGEDLGAQGGSGDVVSVTFTPEGAEPA